MLSSSRLTKLNNLQIPLSATFHETPNNIYLCKVYTKPWVSSQNFTALSCWGNRSYRNPLITTYTPFLCRDLLQIVSTTFVIGYDLEISAEKIIVETNYANLQNNRSNTIVILSQQITIPWCMGWLYQNGGTLWTANVALCEPVFLRDLQLRNQNLLVYTQDIGITILTWSITSDL